MKAELTRTFEIDRGNGVAREIHAWKLLGPRGVIQFKAGPDLSQDIARQFASQHTWIGGIAWTGWDLGYHSPRPTYEGHEAIAESCEDLDGMACYYDGTSLGASELLGKYAAAECDEEVIWAELAERYDSWLCGDDETCASPMTALIQALKRAEAS